MPQGYPPPASHIPYLEITTYLYSFHGGLVNLSLCESSDSYQLIILTSSSITQIIIINITIGTTIWRANNANINSISKIKKSVANTHPTMQTRSAITIIDDKNDINALIYYKYNKFTIIYSKPSTLVMLSISSFNRHIVPSRILPKTLDFIKIIIILFGIKVYC